MRRRYRCLNELSFFGAIYHIVVWLICAFSTVYVFVDDEINIMGLFVIIGFLLLSFCFMNAIRLRYRRYIIKKCGNRYQGYILKAEIDEHPRIGYVKPAYLHIESMINGKRVVIKTKGYAGDPNYILESRECSVYEYNGKYQEDDFVMRKKKNRSCYNIIPIKKIR